MGINKYVLGKTGVTIGLMLLLMAGIAWAGGGTVRCDGTDTTGLAHNRSGTALLDTSSVIQWVGGGQDAPDPASWDKNLRGSRYNVGVNSGSAPGKFFLDDPLLTSGAFIRIWENGGPARDAYYFVTGASGQSGIMPLYNRIPNFNTNYQVRVPYPPAIGGITEVLEKSGTSYNLKLSFGVSGGTLSPDRSTNVELAARSPGGTRYRVQVRKETDSYPDPAAAADSRTIDTNSGVTLTGDYYAPNTKYFIRARAYNYVNPGEDAEITYTTGSMGGGAGPILYHLLKSDSGLGLNAIAALHTVPFSVEGTPGVDTVGKLVAAINTKSGANNTVTTIGWLENGVGDIKGWYITYDAAGTATFTPTGGVTTGSDTPLERGKAYQVSVLKNVDVTFSQ